MKHKPQPQTDTLQDSYLVSLLVPPDHLLLRIKAKVDFAFVRGLVEDLYHPDNGRPATDPALLLGLCFLQTLYGLSDREVLAQTQTDVAMRTFVGLSVEDRLPHPSMLSLFRTHLGEKRFRNIFNQSVQWAVAEGLVSQRLLMVDSGGIRTYKSPNGIDQWEYNTTVMRANDGGTRPMDDPVGHHEGIVLQTAPDGTEQCLIFYFTQRGNLTWIHVTELELGADGKVFVNRNKYPAATQPAK